MTIGICTVAYGTTYHDFLPRWAQAVAALERQPNVITIAHDGVPDDIRDQVRDLLNVLWVEDRTVEHDLQPQVHVNAAIALTHADWIVKLDADDVILPHALNGVPDCTADVLNFGYRVREADHVSQRVTAEQVLRKTNNALSSASPFRRWLWERNKFRDLLFDDWAFWIEAARVGATFDATGRVDYIYSVHDQQLTRRHDQRAARALIDEL